jgi:formamidase
MPDVVFHVDQSRSMRDQKIPGHNRWHPAVPPADSVRPGDEFRMECRDWTDCQIGNNNTANDVRDIDLTLCHMLSGPIRIEGAEPGDLLIVDILDLGPVPQHVGDAAGEGWGYTGVFAKNNGGSFLTDYYPDAIKAIWDFHGQQATSRHLPGVAVHRHHPPGAVRHRAVAGTAGAVEPPGTGPDRHQSRPGAAPGAAAGAHRRTGGPRPRW